MDWVNILVILVDIVFLILLSVLLIKKIRARNTASTKDIVQETSDTPAISENQPTTFEKKEVPKDIKWISAESVSEGGTYYEPLMLEYKGIRYENTNSDPMFLSVLLEADIEKKLVIPDGITGIGVHAFGNFTQLEEIILPNSVKTCNSHAFEDCINLKSIELPSGLEMLEFCLFGNCKNLKSVTIPDTVKEISWKVFRGCDSLEIVEFPDSVSIIGESAFRDCLSLSSIHLPRFLCTVMDSAFYGCTALREITLPCTMSSIPKYCFSYCTGLQYILLKGEENEWRIDENAFAYCTCDIFVEAPSFNEDKLIKAHTYIEIESGMWGVEYCEAWNEDFSGNIYFAGQWHYNEKGKPVRN